MKIFHAAGWETITNEITFKHGAACEIYVIGKDKKTNKEFEINIKHIEKIVGGKDTVKKEDING